MDITRYYQETLDKWQGIADGDGDPRSPCSLCKFSNLIKNKARQLEGCLGCPVLKVWPEIMICDDLPEIAEAYEVRKSDYLPATAAKVVLLLEDNRDALIAAMEETAREHGLEVSPEREMK